MSINTNIVNSKYSSRCFYLSNEQIEIEPEIKRSKQKINLSVLFFHGNICQNQDYTYIKTVRIFKDRWVFLQSTNCIFSCQERVSLIRKQFLTPEF